MSDHRVILLGEAPSRRTDSADALPLSGRSGARLAALLPPGTGPLSAAFRLRNLLRRWPGSREGSKGSGWPTAEARVVAEAVEPFLTGERVILLGSRVARAFGLGGLAPLTWRVVFSGVGCYEAAMLPHPSGVNRWWNDPANVEAARRFLCNAAEWGRR